MKPPVLCRATCFGASIIALMAFAFVWPIASYAGGIDIPEIGVHLGVNIVQGPNKAPVTPQLIRRFDGYEAVLPMGIATLTIARVEDPVPFIHSPERRAGVSEKYHLQGEAKLGGGWLSKTAAYNGGTVLAEPLSPKLSSPHARR
jgi:hypothetical protein